MRVIRRIQKARRLLLLLRVVAKSFIVYIAVTVAIIDRVCGLFAIVTGGVGRAVARRLGHYFHIW